MDVSLTSLVSPFRGWEPAAVLGEAQSAGEGDALAPKSVLTFKIPLKETNVPGMLTHG